MKGSRKDRRSKRIPAAHRMLLTILGPGGSEVAKEIVSTVELSQFGARVRGRRSLRPDSEGVLTQLHSGRQARIRIAWQQKDSESAEYFDTGVEILSGFDYWGISFEDPASATATGLSCGTVAGSSIGVAELLGELKENCAGQASTGNLEILWSALIEQLEANKVITRDELVASIRSIAAGANPPAAASDPGEHPL